MIRHREDQALKVVENMRGGKKFVEQRALLNAPEEMHGRGRLFSRLSVPPGGSVGYHVHEGESETFYILSGSGVFDDNGKPVTCAPGDVLYTPPGHGHAIENTGAEALEFIALILHENQ